MSTANLFEQQESNRRHTVWLVALFMLFFAWVGFGGDLALYYQSVNDPPGAYHHTIPFIGFGATLVAAGICWFSWKSGARRVLWATGAEAIIEPVGEEQQRLVNVVEEMAIASGQPKPQIWVVPDDDPNAFATGMDPAHASIAVTRGLLHLLNRDELQAVVAHEMAHVQNYDTRLMTLLAAMVGAMALMSDGLSRGMRFGGGSSRSSSGSGKKDSNPLGLILIVLWVVTLIVAPIISNLLSMAVSRKREYLADATGAQFTRNPAALASALEKLDSAVAPTQSITRGAAHLCIVDPAARKISQREGLLGDIFASHPPIKQRIIRLNGMAYQFAKAGGGSAGTLPTA
ncbi:MAG: M48 family metallopeptidase [Gemmatimonadota bacterium]